MTIIAKSGLVLAGATPIESGGLSEPVAAQQPPAAGALPPPAAPAHPPGRSARLPQGRAQDHRRSDVAEERVSCRSG